MNRDEVEQLEDLLRGLPLRRPSPDLDRRVASLWRARSVRWKRLRLGGALAAATALAAGIVLIVSLRNPDDGQPGSPSARTDQPGIAKVAAQPAKSADRPFGEALRYPTDGMPAPVRIEQVWSTQGAEEVVVLDDALPMRRVHHQVLRHVRWIDERRNLHIEWNIPSRETVVVPLQYN